MSNEPTIPELERALRILNDAATTGKDFVWEQAPLVAKEVVYWTIADSAISLVFWVMPLVASIILLKVVTRWAKKNWESFASEGSEPILMFPYGAIAVAIWISSSFVFDSARGIAKGIAAPPVSSSSTT